MKKIIFLCLVFLILAACTQYTVIMPNETSIKEIKPVQNTTVTVAKNTTTVAKPIQTINSTKSKVEILGVDEQGKSCLLRVGDVTDVINEGETKTINGVTITVTAAFAMHAAYPTDDSCQMIIK